METVLQEIEVDKPLYQLFPGMTKQEIVNRALMIRKEAMEKESPHRCVEGLFFLKETLYRNSFNAEAFPKDSLPNLRIFEVGSCFGVALRKLLLDGASRSNIFGIDVSDTFVRLGYQFFDDKASFGDRIRVLNVLADNFFDVVREWAGPEPFDVVIANLVFHCLPDHNDVLAERAYSLLKPGGVLIGQTAAYSKDTDEPFVFGMGPRKAVLHSENSFKKLIRSHGFQTVKVNFNDHPMEKEDIQWMSRHYAFDEKETNGLSLMSFIAMK
ncbi:hypothetical protein GpartN1_g4614.t1 [Galdieria partita]|uniref:Methyltransferase type 12 domain-containing protein n=1 Tax=Galdieria partita TaxID=83374 RepID=A0A9C7PXN9_9RHOD|nr:hypothetical protein GpartN1_g4614.t1 [Galdieria partita]